MPANSSSPCDPEQDERTSCWKDYIPEELDNPIVIDDSESDARVEEIAEAESLQQPVRVLRDEIRVVEEAVGPPAECPEIEPSEDDTDFSELEENGVTTNLRLSTRLDAIEDVVSEPHVAFPLSEFFIEEWEDEGDNEGDEMQQEDKAEKTYEAEQSTQQEIEEEEGDSEEDDEICITSKKQFVERLHPSSHVEPVDLTQEESSPVLSSQQNTHAIEVIDLAEEETDQQDSVETLRAQNSESSNIQHCLHFCNRIVPGQGGQTETQRESGPSSVEPQVKLSKQQKKRQRKRHEKQKKLEKRMKKREERARIRQLNEMQAELAQSSLFSQHTCTFTQSSPAKQDSAESTEHLPAVSFSFSFSVRTPSSSPNAGKEVHHDSTLRTKISTSSPVSSLCNVHVEATCSTPRTASPCIASPCSLLSSDSILAASSSCASAQKVQSFSEEPERSSRKKKRKDCLVEDTQDQELQEQKLDKAKTKACVVLEEQVNPEPEHPLANKELCKIAETIGNVVNLENEAQQRQTPRKEQKTEPENLMSENKISPSKRGRKSKKKGTESIQNEMNVDPVSVNIAVESIAQDQISNVRLKSRRNKEQNVVDDAQQQVVPEQTQLFAAQTQTIARNKKLKVQPQDSQTTPTSSIPFEKQKSNYSNATVSEDGTEKLNATMKPQSKKQERERTKRFKAIAQIQADSMQESDETAQHKPEAEYLPDRGSTETKKTRRSLRKQQVENPRIVSNETKEDARDHLSKNTKKSTNRNDIAQPECESQQNGFLKTKQRSKAEREKVQEEGVESRQTTLTQEKENSSEKKTRKYKKNSKVQDLQLEQTDASHSKLDTAHTVASHFPRQLEVIDPRKRKKNKVIPMEDDNELASEETVAHSQDAPESKQETRKRRSEERAARKQKKQIESSSSDVNLRIRQKWKSLPVSPQLRPEPDRPAESIFPPLLDLSCIKPPRSQRHKLAAQRAQKMSDAAAKLHSEREALEPGPRTRYHAPRQFKVRWNAKLASESSHTKRRTSLHSILKTRSSYPQVIVLPELACPPTNEEMKIESTDDDNEDEDYNTGQDVTLFYRNMKVRKKTKIRKRSPSIPILSSIPSPRTRSVTAAESAAADAMPPLSLDAISEISAPVTVPMSVPMSVPDSLMCSSSVNPACNSAIPGPSVPSVFDFPEPQWQKRRADCRSANVSPQKNELRSSRRQAAQKSAASPSAAPSSVASPPPATAPPATAAPSLTAPSLTAPSVSSVSSSSPAVVTPSVPFWSLAPSLPLVSLVSSRDSSVEGRSSERQTREASASGSERLLSADDLVLPCTSSCVPKVNVDYSGICLSSVSPVGLQPFMSPASNKVKSKRSRYTNAVVNNNSTSVSCGSGVSVLSAMSPALVKASSPNYVDPLSSPTLVSKHSTCSPSIRPPLHSFVNHDLNSQLEKTLIIIDDDYDMYENSRMYRETPAKPHAALMSPISSSSGDSSNSCSSHSCSNSGSHCLKMNESFGELESRLQIVEPTRLSRFLSETLRTASVLPQLSSSLPFCALPSTQLSSHSPPFSDSCAFSTSPSSSCLSSLSLASGTFSSPPSSSVSVSSSLSSFDSPLSTVSSLPTRPRSLRKCSFCNVADMEWLGTLLGPVDLFRQARWFHTKCLMYSGRLLNTDLPSMFLQAQTKCCLVCHKVGAVGCVVKGCVSSYHVPCFRNAACIPLPEFQIVCDEHKHMWNTKEKDKTAVVSPYLHPSSGLSSPVSQLSLPQLPSSVPTHDLSALLSSINSELKPTLDVSSISLVVEENKALWKVNAQLMKYMNNLGGALVKGLPCVNLAKSQMQQTATRIIARCQAAWIAKNKEAMRKIAKWGKQKKTPQINGADRVLCATACLLATSSQLGTLIDLPGRDNDRLWLATLSRKELRKLREHIREFLQKSGYWDEAGSKECSGSPASRSPDGQLLSWCVIVPLPASYFVKSMEGQQGICAGKSIPAFTVLTRYTGPVFALKDFDELYQATVEENSRDDYSLVFNVPDETGAEHELVIDGLDGGFSRMFNDYRRNVEVGGEAMNDSSLINVQFVHVCVCGDPMILAISTKATPEGAPLLCDYGEGFWERWREARLRAQKAQQFFGNVRAGLREPIETSD